MNRSTAIIAALAALAFAAGLIITAAIAPRCGHEVFGAVKIGGAITVMGCP